MNVTRGQIIARGITGRCPNCGERTLFPPGWGLRIHRQCSNCGLIFDRSEGFFLGPFVVNYSAIVFGFLPLVALAFVAGAIGRRTALTIAGTGILVLPLVLYRLTWSWWLTGYFYFLPQKLLKNDNGSHEDEEE
jgi:uncharacterized protein (DUF983 family)